MDSHVPPRDRLLDHRRPPHPRRRGRLLASALSLLAAGALAGTALTSPANGSGAVAPTVATASASADVAEPARAPLVRLAAAGDTGTGDAAERRTVAAMVDASTRHRFDSVLLLGDLVYPEGDPRLVPRTVTRPFRPLTRRGAELVPALGNHDYQMGRPDAIMRRLGRDQRRYVERAGPVRIVVLDSNRVHRPQTRWLRRTLRHEPRWAQWTIVILHHPPFSAGEHGSDRDVRRAWSPVFARFDVPLVLAGHEHDYQRIREIRGVRYVVSGGGAKTRPTGRAPFTEVSRSVLHFLDLAVYRHRIVVRAINQSGGLVDRFVVRKP
jgi:3',5'-cyclic AMP phosphodiesterase CpdA